MTTPQVKIKGTFASEDRRFLEEMCKVIATLDGSSKMHIRTSQYPSRIKCVVQEPPELAQTDLKQIELMNNRISEMTMDVKEKTFMVELWKEGAGKKRRRDEWVDYDGELPKRYIVDAQKEDKPVLENILKTLLGMDNYLCEFEVDIVRREASYDLVIKDIEPVKWSFIRHLHKTYRAFISEIRFDFPNSCMRIIVRRNDSPVDLKVT